VSRTSAVALLQEEINRRDRMLGELNQAMNTLQQTVGLAQEEINRRDRMLGELVRTVNELQEEINLRDRMLEELNRTVHERQHRLSDRVLRAVRAWSWRGRRALGAIGGLTRWTNDAG
jgi:peptidoglycan hydrolase CwlO-like protein